MRYLLIQYSSFIYRIKYNFHWWIAQHIPARSALYAFVRVHALSGNGPSYDGEYRAAYNLWIEKHNGEGW